MEHMDKIKIPFEKLVSSPNIAKLLTSEQLKNLGGEIVDNYSKDRKTRMEWEERNAKAIKLALQVVESKSFPWTNCSNIKFPLVTVAALQFLARISILTKGRNLVKLEGIGADPEGKKAAQASRVSTHLSMQLVDGDVTWIDDDEKAKLSAAILGCSIKKTYYDGISGNNISEFIPAMDFVVDYYCKDIDKANRATHTLHLSGNYIQERVRRGLFLEMDDTSPSSYDTNLLSQVSDEISGLHSPQSESGEEYEILEQHCWLDLDDDGYKEPYIVLCRKDTAQVLRIVARFFDVGDVHRVNDREVLDLEQQASQEQDLVKKSQLEKKADRMAKGAENHIVRIDPELFFTKYTFIPSPDGGFYGLGLGAVLGPINEAVNTLVNQLTDNGTMSVTAGGFLGRGVKIKGGKTSFDPFEWKPVDSTGDDLKKNIFPLPVRDPSNVLFQLLGLLVSYGEKVSGATDIMTGTSPGQNTPAETSRNTVEQGMMLFSGIYGRMYRSFRDELKKMYELNRLFLRASPQYYSLTQGPDAIIAPDDYSANRFRIFPSADPGAVSQSQRREKAGVLLKIASSEPGFNKYLVVRNFLEAYDYDNIDAIFPDPSGPSAIPAPANPKVELEKAKLQQQQQQHQDEMSLSIAEFRAEMTLNEAKISELQAKATRELAEAQGVDVGHQIAIIEAQIGAAKSRQDGMIAALNILQKTHAASMKNHQPAEGMSHGSERTGSAGMGISDGNTGVSSGADGGAGGSQEQLGASGV